ncbi:MAG: PfkB family carbohydrate kinase, partial [Myxococcota bacterium]
SVLFADDRRWRIRAAPAHVVDTTGAGDVLAATMLAALAAGAPPTLAAQLGSAAASVVVEATATDALAHLPDRVDLRRKAVSIWAE